MKLVGKHTSAVSASSKQVWIVCWTLKTRNRRSLHHSFSVGFNLSQSTEARTTFLCRNKDSSLLVIYFTLGLYEIL